MKKYNCAKCFTEIEKYKYLCIKCIKEYNKTWYYKIGYKCPKNWISGRPIKIFGIYLFTLWRCGKKNYQYDKNYSLPPR